MMTPSGHHRRQPPARFSRPIRWQDWKKSFSTSWVKPAATGRCVQSAHSTPGYQTAWGIFGQPLTGLGSVFPPNDNLNCVLSSFLFGALSLPFSSLQFCSLSLPPSLSVAPLIPFSSLPLLFSLLCNPLPVLLLFLFPLSPPSRYYLVCCAQPPFCPFSFPPFPLPSTVLTSLISAFLLLSLPFFPPPPRFRHDVGCCTVHSRLWPAQHGRKHSRQPHRRSAASRCL